VGLAAVKGIAEVRGLSVVTLSRLKLLAEAGQAACSVLDAHQGQYYCGFYGQETQEVLLTAGEINARGGLRGRVAVCEETVAQSLEELCGEPEVVRVAAPTAADALRLSVAQWKAGEFADLASLDGYYLRGADAKIAGRSV
jgi:tRNA A37 threonylcarbamoyladenosine modification protein TsaB